MECPKDQNLTETRTIEAGGYYTQFKRCPVCHSLWVEEKDLDRIPLDAGSRIDDEQTNMPDENIYHCPIDNDSLLPIAESDRLGTKINQCPNCHGIWFQPGQLRIYLEDLARRSATEKLFVGPSSLRIISGTLASFIFASLLVYIQTSGANADQIAALQPQTSVLSLIVWLITFLILFTVPMSIYLQVVIHDKQLKQALRHPLTVILPVVVIILSLINVLVINPIFK